MAPPSPKPESSAHAVNSLLQSMWTRKTFTLCQFFIISSCYVSGAFQLFCNIFSARPVEHHCRRWNASSRYEEDILVNQSNLNLTSTECNMAVYSEGKLVERLACTDWEYSEPKDVSIVSEFDLVCDRKSLAPLLQSLFIVGQGLGALIFPAISDKKGRRPVLLATQLAMLVFGIAQAFAPNYTALAVYKVFLGAFQQGGVLVSSTMILEILPVSVRSHVLWMGMILFTLSTVALVPFVYFLRNASWTTLLLALCSGSIFIVPSFFLVEETLVWLVANGKNERARQLLCNSCKWNGADTAPLLQQYQDTIPSSKTESIGRYSKDTKTSSSPMGKHEGGITQDSTDERLLDSEEKFTQGSTHFDNGMSNLDKLLTDLQANELKSNGRLHSLTRDSPSNDLSNQYNQIAEKTIDLSSENTNMLSDTGDGDVQKSDQELSSSKKKYSPIFTRGFDSKLETSNDCMEISAVTADSNSPGHNGHLFDAVSYSKREHLGSYVDETDLESAAVRNARSSNVVKMFTNRILLINIIIFWLIWFVDSFSYFMLFLTTGMLADNLYLNFLLGSLAELPATVLLVIIPKWWGRKATLICFQLIFGISLLLPSLIHLGPESTVLRTFSSVVSMLGKIGVTAAFAFNFVYTPETFPTNMRNFAVGSSSTAGRIGGALSPFVSLLSTSTMWLPGVVFSASSLVLCLLIRMLPETSGKDLPQTVSDVVSWYKAKDKKQTCLSCFKKCSSRSERTVGNSKR